MRSIELETGKNMKKGKWLTWQLNSFCVIIIGKKNAFMCQWLSSVEMHTAVFIICPTHSSIPGVEKESFQVENCKMIRADI